MSPHPEDRKLARLERSKVHPGSNARTEVDQNRLAELVESLRNVKQQSPVIVYPHPELPDNYLLADGYRRWLALGLVPWDEIEAVILARKPDDIQLLEIQLSLGVTNEKLSPYDLADGAQKIAVARKLTQGEVAALVGVSPSKLSKAQTIREDAAPALRSDIESGLIPFSVAAAIARLPDHTRQAELASKVKLGLLKRASVEREVAKLLGGKPKSAKPIRAEQDGATLTVPGSSSWEFVQALGKQLVDAATKGIRNQLPTASLPSLLKKA